MSQKLKNSTISLINSQLLVQGRFYKTPGNTIVNYAATDK